MYFVHVVSLQGSSLQESEFRFLTACVEYGAVDVDHNLNTAINKVREVLGDSAENPRYVETLPRRG